MAYFKLNNNMTDILNQTNKENKSGNNGTPRTHLSQQNENCRLDLIEPVNEG
jgi:hypothetical protein